MWKLIVRGGRGTPFTKLGSFSSIGDAARKILEMENDPRGAVFFRVYVDPINPLFGADDDSAALSRLEYQSAKHYHLLTLSGH
jgi:hypothetical protein